MLKILPILLTLPAMVASLLDRLVPAFIANRLLQPAAVAAEEALSGQVDDMLAHSTRDPTASTPHRTPAATSAAEKKRTKDGGTHMHAHTHVRVRPLTPFGIPADYLDMPTTTTTTAASASAGFGAMGGSARILAPLSSDAFRSRFIKWASAKTGGLGTNISFSKKTDQPASMGSTLQFNISPFFRPVLSLPPKSASAGSKKKKKTAPAMSPAALAPAPASASTLAQPHRVPLTPNAPPPGFPALPPQPFSPDAEQFSIGVPEQTSA
jgi:hypothetical protein